MVKDKERTVDFWKILGERKNEDVETIRSIEELLIKKRGRVFKMPKPGSHVIHLLSGGIDSVSCWAILMQKYRLVVHPVCVITGQKRHHEEEKAIKYFSELFSKKYKKYFVKPFDITFPSSTPEISKVMRGDLNKLVHPEILKKNFDIKSDSVLLTRNYLFPAFFPYPAALAALLFDWTTNQRIRTIFCSVLPTDGVMNASQTLTALRAATLSLCAFTGDYSWQVVSTCFEKETNFMLEKSDLIRWSVEKKIPIEKTYTCLKGKKFHCGECATCYFRKEQFKKAGVEDTTVYKGEKETAYKKMKAKIVGKWNKITSFRGKKIKVMIKDYH